MTKPTRYNDLAEAFPAHNLQLDVVLQGRSAWEALAQAQAILQPCEAELLTLTYRKNGTISLRVRCACHDELAKIDAKLRASNTLRVVSSSITIGAPIRHDRAIKPLE